MFYANHPQIIYDINLEIENARNGKANLDARLDESDVSSNGKIKSIIFTASGVTTVIPIGLTYDSLIDRLSVVDLYYGSKLTLGDHYSEADSNINLIGWSLAIGQKLEITVVTNAKL